MGLYKRPTNAHPKTPFTRLSLRFLNDDGVARKLKKVEEKVEEEKVENSGVGSLISAGGVSPSWRVEAH